MQTEQISEKFTIAFSNTPGPIKPFIYETPEGTGRTLKSQTYIMVAGKCGLNVAAISFCNSFMITCTSDSNVF